MQPLIERFKGLGGAGHNLIVTDPHRGESRELECRTSTVVNIFRRSGRNAPPECGVIARLAFRCWYDLAAERSALIAIRAGLNTCHSGKVREAIDTGALAQAWSGVSPRTQQILPRQ
jgi:hypothetical protein